MEDVIAFLYENLNGFLATVGDGKPHVRPFQFLMEDDGKLYFATNNTKNVYFELKETPFLEFAISTPDFSNNLRINGPVTFVDDLSLNEKLLDNYDFLKQIYSTPDSPVFQVFCVEHGTASFWSHAGSQSIAF